MTEILVQERLATPQPVQPAAVGAPPQRVYETKNTLFRFNQLIWSLLGLAEVLISFRIVLKALAANSDSGFVQLIYAVSNLLIWPFRGIFGIGVSGSSVIESAAIVAMVVYAVAAWGLVYLLNLINPVTPKMVATEGV